MNKTPISSISKKSLVVLLFFIISPYIYSQTFYWEKILTGNPNYLLLKDSLGNIYHSDKTGFYKSTDDGDSWTLIFYEPQKTLNEVSIDSSGVFWGIFNEQPGVYNSTNSGSDWNLIGLEDYEFKIIKISPDHKIWVVSDSVLFNSSNLGVSWDIFEFNKYSRTLSFIENKVLLVTSVAFYESGSILLSLDYGITWEDIWPLSLFTYGTFDNEGNIYLSSGFFPFWAGIRKSTDNGITWEHIYELASGGPWFDEQDRMYRSNFYRSTDHGVNWRLLGWLPNMSNVLFKDSLIFIGCIHNQGDHAGIWRTGLNEPYIGNNYMPLEVGNIWQYFWSYPFQRHGIGIQYIEKDTIINELEYFELMGQTEALIRYDDSSKILYRRVNDSNYVCFDFTLNLYSIFVRVPLWHDLDTPRESEIDSVHWINFDDSSYHIRSIKSLGSLYIYYETYCENFGQIYLNELNVYYGWSNGILIRAIINNGDSVRYYSDGKNPIIYFQPILTTDKFSVEFLLQVDHDYTFSQNGVVYNFIDSVLIHSYYSNGDTVIVNNPAILINQPNTVNYSLVLVLDSLLMTNNFNYYYKIYAVDKGVVKESSHRPDSSYYKLVYDTTTTNISKFEKNIFDFVLFQNHPNPFNPITTIKIHIPELSFVTLKVYDVLGSEIATLVNEEKPSGSYEVEFNSHSGSVRNLPSGIYFYQLKAESFIQTKKMILIK